MTLYLLIIVLTCIGIIGHDLKPDSYATAWRSIFLALIASVILMVGLRENIGFDTHLMQWKITDGPSIPEMLAKPVGIPVMRHNFIYDPLRVLGEKGVTGAVQLLYASLLNIPLAFFILKNTRYWFSAFLLYLIFNFTFINFEVNLQGAAIGIFLWSWKDLVSRHFYSYLLKILLATFFHFTAVVLLILPFLFNKKTEKFLSNLKVLLPLMGVIMICALSIKSLSPLIHQFSINSNPDTFIGYFWVRMDVYLNKFFFLSRLNLKYFLLYICFPLSLLLLQKRCNSGRFFILATSLYLIIQSAGTFVEPISRFALYIYPILTVATINCIPYALLQLRKIAATRSIGRSGIITGIWAFWLTTAITIYIHNFTVSIPPTEGKVYEKYYPYCTLVNDDYDPFHNKFIDDLQEKLNISTDDEHYPHYSLYLNDSIHEGQQ